MTKKKPLVQPAKLAPKTKIDTPTSQLERKGYGGQLQINPELVRRLAFIHCTQKEIAAIVGCSVDTIHRRFLDVIEQGMEKGKMSLRRKLFHMALKQNNTAVAIWLSKQHLGFRDKQPDEAQQVNFMVYTQDIPK